LVLASRTKGNVNYLSIDRKLQLLYILWWNSSLFQCWD